jgi:DHA1 family bicyclomycin/chloramphenicol resistance-like MFS transporter
MTQTSPAAAQPIVRPSFIALLVAVSAVSPLGINMYLPSMPGMARAFSVDFTTIQLTLSLYLAAMALGQLIIGPLSDRFGRRPVLLIGLTAFVAGSLICFLAQNVSLLIFGRVVQAMGGSAGITLSRAIVRDLFGRNQVASMIGYVTMGMAVAPMIAPTIGGVLDTYFG